MFYGSIVYIGCFNSSGILCVPALASLIAVVGLLKVEEICCIDGSIIQVRNVCQDAVSDLAKGAAHTNTTRSFMEDISARRSLRMITYGSFPLYLAVFAHTVEVFCKDIVQYQQANGPFLFTVSGAIAAIVFFHGIHGFC